MWCVCKPLILRQEGKTLQKRLVKIHLRVKEKKRVSKERGKNASIKKEGEKLICKHCSKEGHDEAHCWKLHPEMKPKKFNNKGKQKTTATTQQDLGSNSGDETKITAMGMKGK